MINYINLLLNGVGLPNVVMLSEIREYFGSITTWSQIFEPTILFSSLFYLLCSWGVFSIALILPYRLFKKIIRYPSKKGCEH